MTHRVTLIPGDWIGPETTGVVRRMIEHLGVSIDWETFEGLQGEIPNSLLESARSTGCILMARVASDPAPGKLPVTVQLRKALGLYAQVRHVRNLPGLPARFSNVDLSIVRETSEDIYTGIEHESAPGVYESIKLTTEKACERIARFAYEHAVNGNRKLVTVVHKSNIMKLSDGLLLKTALRVAEDYPQIETNEVIVDALCMHMVRNPSRFDVLLCGNLFGDIVADLAAGLAGGISVGGASNHGEGDCDVREPSRKGARAGRKRSSQPHSSVDSGNQPSPPPGRKQRCNPPKQGRGALSWRSSNGRTRRQRRLRKNRIRLAVGALGLH